MKKELSIHYVVEEFLKKVAPLVWATIPKKRDCEFCKHYQNEEDTEPCLSCHYGLTGWEKK